MTFSLIARAADGMFGTVVTSSSISVASRCGGWARAGVGAVATQNVTDPALGALGLKLLARGTRITASSLAIIRRRHQGAPILEGAAVVRPAA